eukprot:gene16062-24594_t
MRSVLQGLAGRAGMELSKATPPAAGEQRPPTPKPLVPVPAKVSDPPAAAVEASPTAPRPAASVLTLPPPSVGTPDPLSAKRMKGRSFYGTRERAGSPRQRRPSGVGLGCVGSAPKAAADSDAPPEAAEAAGAGLVTGLCVLVAAVLRAKAAEGYWAAWPHERGPPAFVRQEAPADAVALPGVHGQGEGVLSLRAPVLCLRVYRGYSLRIGYDACRVTTHRAPPLPPKPGLHHQPPGNPTHAAQTTLAIADFPHAMQDAPPSQQPVDPRILPQAALAVKSGVPAPHSTQQAALAAAEAPHAPCTNPGDLDTLALGQNQPTDDRSMAQAPAAADQPASTRLAGRGVSSSATHRAQRRQPADPSNNMSTPLANADSFDGTQQTRRVGRVGRSGWQEDGASVGPLMNHGRQQQQQQQQHPADPSTAAAPLAHADSFERTQQTQRVGPSVRAGRSGWHPGGEEDGASVGASTMNTGGKSCGVVAVAEVAGAGAGEAEADAVGGGKGMGDLRRRGGRVTGEELLRMCRELGWVTERGDLRLTMSLPAQAPMAAGSLWTPAKDRVKQWTVAFSLAQLALLLDAPVSNSLHPGNCGPGNLLYIGCRANHHFSFALCFEAAYQPLFEAVLVPNESILSALMHQVTTSCFQAFPENDPLNATVTAGAIADCLRQTREHTFEVTLWQAASQIAVRPRPSAGRMKPGARRLHCRPHPVPKRIGVAAGKGPRACLLPETRAAEPQQRQTDLCSPAPDAPRSGDKFSKMASQIVKAAAVKTFGVIGAGQMGNGIAQ